MKQDFPEDKEVLAKLVRNKNVIRAQLRRLTISDIEKFLEVAEEVHVEKQVEEEQKAEEEVKRQERLAELKQIMAEHGITPDELKTEAKPKRGRPRKKAENGETAS